MRQTSTEIKNEYLSTRFELCDRVEWRNENGDLHRCGAPAVEYMNGSKEWHFEGELQFKYIAA